MGRKPNNIFNEDMRKRLKRAGLLRAISTHITHLTSAGMPHNNAVNIAVEQIQPLLAEFEAKMMEKGLEERVEGAIKHDESAIEREAKKGAAAHARSFLDLDRAAEGKACSPLESVNWAVANKVKGMNLEELEAGEWRALKKSAPSTTAVAYLHTFCTTNVDTKTIEDALKRKDAGEEEQQTTLVRDANRLSELVDKVLGGLAGE